MAKSDKKKKKQTGAEVPDVAAPTSEEQATPNKAEKRKEKLLSKLGTLRKAVNKAESRLEKALDSLADCRVRLHAIETVLDPENAKLESNLIEFIDQGCCEEHDHGDMEDDFNEGLHLAASSVNGENMAGHACHSSEPKQEQGGCCQVHDHNHDSHHGDSCQTKSEAPAATPEAPASGEQHS